MKRKYGVLFFMCLLNIACASSNTSKNNSTTKTIKIGKTTFSSTSLKVNNWNDDEIVKNSIKSFKVLGLGETSLHEYILGTYAIKARIKNDNEEKDICLIVDTGAMGNLIQRNVLQQFSIPFKEKYKFISNYTYSTVSNWDVSGIIIPHFQAEGFKMEEVLFEPVDIESFGWLEDGTPVNGVIGMITLSQLPFLFSAKTKKLVFFNKDFNPKGTRVELISKYPLVLEVPVEINEKTYSVKIDTGAETNLIPYSLYKKSMSNIDGNFELRMFGLKRMMGLQKSMSFYNKECLNIPTVAQKKSFMFGSSDYVMVGETVLRNFDLYVDYYTSTIYFDPVECVFPKRSMLKVYTSGGGNRYGYFGINIVRERYGNNLKVASIYYKDGIKLCPEISIGDYVISINGIDQKDFILEDLQNYDSIEITLKHKNKIYSVSLDRSHFEKCLEY